MEISLWASYTKHFAGFISVKPHNNPLVLSQCSHVETRPMVAVGLSQGLSGYTWRVWATQAV